jgi:hypothetical protein
VIEGQIVFVLGAGASRDYGFPLGYELVHAVMNKLAKDTETRRRFVGYTGCSEEEVSEFIHSLNASAHNSVDAFLEHRREFMKVGKAAIAYCLIECEHPDKLYRERDPTGNWLRYLLAQMRSNTFEEFASNKVGFITFNYDRCLEYFLCTALAASFKRAEEESAEVLNKIPIIHVHGQLGYLPAWGKKNSRPFWLEPDADMLRMCIEEIKVMHEGADVVTPEYEKARNLLATANKVYFMGVGFNSLNLQRLAIKSLNDDIAYATGRGLNSNETGRLQSQFGRKLHILTNCDCLTMLRQHVNWN